MALPSSGQISMSQVNTEAGLTSTDQLTMTQAFSVLDYYPNSDGVNPLSMSELYSAEGVASRNTTWKFSAHKSMSLPATITVSAVGGSSKFVRSTTSWLNQTQVVNNTYLKSGTQTSVSVNWISVAADFNSFLSLRLYISAYNRNTGGTKGTLITTTYIDNAQPTTNQASPTITFNDTLITNNSLWVEFEVLWYS